MSSDEDESDFVKGDLPKRSLNYGSASRPLAADWFRRDNNVDAASAAMGQDREQGNEEA